MLFILFYFIIVYTVDTGLKTQCLRYIVDTYFKNEIPVTQNIYYMGMSLTHDLANNKCESTTDNLITKCRYKHNMFDILLM